MSEERIKALAEAMKEASHTDQQGVENQAGLIGGNYLWGVVASRLITMMEEIAREAVDQYLNKEK